MSLSESACYTLINAPDSEPFNEMQIKQDLGRFDNSLRRKLQFVNILRKSLQKRARSPSR
jgi:hypothetical protein